MSFDLINPTYIFIGGFLLFLFIGLLFYVLFTWLRKGNKISSRLDEFVVPEVQPTDTSKPIRIIPREISGSLLNRTIITWVKKIFAFLGKLTPKRMSDDLEHKLVIAGKPGNLNAGNFFTIQILVFFAGIILAFFVNKYLKDITNYSVLVGLLVVVLGLVLPISWLNGRMRNRQDEIQRGLPDALDMLSVCASAGLGFDQSLQKISVYWENELGREFKRVTQEMEMGVVRATALRNMSTRLEVNDLSQFISIIIQAEKIGMSYATVLHSQALQLRVLRQVRAREIANQLPGKIIIPVILFIFPALIAVILGPAVPIILDVF